MSTNPNYWLDEDPLRPNAVRFHKGNVCTYLYRWTQVNDVLQQYGRTMPGCELLSKFPQPVHKDGQVWLEADPDNPNAVRFYQQLSGGDQRYRLLVRWTEVNQILQEQQRYGRIVEGAELLSRLPAPAHKDGQSWLEEDPAVPHAVRFCTQLGNGYIRRKLLYRWTEVNQIITQYGQNIEGAELLAKFPAPAHKDGQSWLEEDACVPHAVRFCTQLNGGDIQWQLLYRWTEVNNILTQYGRTIEGAELLEKFTPPAHTDGQVWFAEDPHEPKALRFYTQISGGDQQYRLIYSWTEATSLVRQYQRNGQALPGAELIAARFAPLNDTLETSPPSKVVVEGKFQEGDVWLETNPAQRGLLRLCRLVNGNVEAQAVTSRVEAESLLALYGRPPVGGSALLDELWPLPQF